MDEIRAEQTHIKHQPPETYTHTETGRKRYERPDGGGIDAKQKGRAVRKVRGVC